MKCWESKNIRQRFFTHWQKFSKELPHVENFAGIMDASGSEFTTMLLHVEIFAGIIVKAILCYCICSAMRNKRRNKHAEFSILLLHLFSYTEQMS